MAPRSFFGFDDRGMLGFDLGDGEPTWLPPTGTTVQSAMRLEAAAGRDPAAVLARQGGAGFGPPPALDPGLLDTLPARRGAMSPDALAANSPLDDAIALDRAAKGKKSLYIDTSGAPPPTAPVLRDVSVGLGGRIDLSPAPAPAAPAAGAGLPQLTPEQIAKGFDGKAGAGPAPLVPQSGGGDLRALVAQDQAAKAAAAKEAAGPPQLVPTPQQASGPAAPNGKLPPPGLNAQAYQEWLKSEIAAEASKRPSGGTLVKGGKVQTAESWQGQVGPNADTVEELRRNAAARATNDKLVAASDADLVAKKADIEGQIADAEQQAAAKKAEIQQRSTETLGQIGGEIRGLQQKIASAEVDPTRWWSSKSTGDKAVLAIATFLGGVSQVLTKTADKPNPILQATYAAMDKDVEAQVRNIDKQRGDLNDLQRIYVQTREQFGDEAVAVDAAKLAALQGFRAQIAQETAKAQAVQGTEAAHDPRSVQEMADMEAAFREAMGGDSPLAQQAAEARFNKIAQQTRSFSVRGRALELAAQQAELEKRADLEAKINGSLAKQYGFTQDRVVGGSTGADRKVIRGLFKELNDVEGDQRKLSVSEREAMAKGKDVKGLFIDGEFVAANPNAQGEVLKDAQARVSYADSLLNDIGAVRKRMNEAGAYAPGDPQAKIDAGLLAKSLSRAASNEAASEQDVKNVQDAVTPGPRQEAALQRLENKARSFKTDAMKSVGAAR